MTSTTRDDAKAWRNGEDAEPEPWDDDKSASLAERWAAGMLKAFDKEPHGQPEIFARALTIYLGSRPGAVARELAADLPDDVTDLDPDD